MADTVVSSLATAYSTFLNAPANDRVLLANGTYNQVGRKSLTKNASGPVTFRAQNIGSAIITGDPIDLNSPDIIFEGFDLQYSLATGDYSTINGANCRFTRNKVHFNDTSAGTQHWQIVLGNNCTVDHNEFYNKSVLGNMLLVGTSNSIVTGTQIYKNYFHDHSAAGGNGGETLRLGSSETAWIDFNSAVYLNRFENCSGDPECVTIKSSNNDIHHNTFISCNASLSLRHGNNNKVNDNFLKDTGFRFFGHGHTIKRNQIVQDSHNQLRGHLLLLNGDQQDDDGSTGITAPSNNKHAQVYNCVIENNLIMAKNVTTNIIFCLGYNGSTVNPNFKPFNNSILNNIITGSLGTLTKENDGALWSANPSISGNIVNATGTATVGDMPVSGYTTQAHNLTEKADGTWRCCTVLTPQMVGVAAP